jgi:hypothetical protein
MEHQKLNAERAAQSQILDLDLILKYKTIKYMKYNNLCQDFS